MNLDTISLFFELRTMRSSGHTVMRSHKRSYLYAESMLASSPLLFTE